MPIKMYAIFARETLEQMQFQGKLAAQAGHAYLHAYWDAETTNDDDYYFDVVEAYKTDNDARKIALVVDTVEQLQELYGYARRDGFGATLVEDCGYTVFTEPTITAVGIGPINDDNKPEYLKTLETLKMENLC